jgi:hypothetical protein
MRLLVPGVTPYLSLFQSDVKCAFALFLPCAYLFLADQCRTICRRIAGTLTALWFTAIASLLCDPFSIQ